jgi:hypothetical protein
MTIDMTNNRVPYGLLTDEEAIALHEHEKAGGTFEHHCDGVWFKSLLLWVNDTIYRTVPLPAQRSEQSSLKTQDVIAWERLPAWVQWVVRDKRGDVWACDADRFHSYNGRRIRIDDWPGIVQIGTVDWCDSKQLRPK